MYSFGLALLLLIIGYFTYGKYIAHVFGPDPNRKTPCYSMEDGVDYVPMPTWKVYMIQFLNIAGVGPIFGAIMGSQFGTASYLWIVFGTIFAGAVHDYISAMLSVRNEGESLPQLISRYLGERSKPFVTFFAVLLLVLVGTVFTSSPANILSAMTRDYFSAENQWINQYGWILLIFVYYVLATLCPVDKIIGKIYPFFAFCLIFMAVGLMGYIFIAQPHLPELWDEGSLVNHVWQKNPMFPMMFISIACGAISGFHGTQSPMMARCLKNEKVGRECFYGAMVTEGIVALVWAAAATYFFGENGVINEVTGKGYDGGTVATMISKNWLGLVGGILAIIGVAVAPITSGDTALRSARLMIADYFHIEQKSIGKRQLISIPLFIATAAILIWSMTDNDGFQKLWRYFGWSNQTLATFTLWSCTVALWQFGKNYWVTFIPACFMTVVCTSFILLDNTCGFGLPYALSIWCGVILAIVLAIIFIANVIKANKAKK